MNLIIYTNSHYEEEKALVNLDTKEVILKGDYYHDKIEHLIEGYLQALRDLNMYNGEIRNEEINSNHDMYDELEFYNEDASCDFEE
jgi:hypothetical protein